MAKFVRSNFRRFQQRPAISDNLMVVCFISFADGNDWLALDSGYGISRCVKYFYRWISINSLIFLFLFADFGVISEVKTCVKPNEQSETCSAFPWRGNEGAAYKFNCKL